MLCIERFRQSLAAGRSAGRIVAVAAVSAVAAGCSADVARFDQPAFGLTESGAKSANPTPSETARRNGGSVPIVDEGQVPSGGAYIPPSNGRGSQTTRMTALPDPQPAPIAPLPPVADANRAPATGAPLRGATPVAAPAPATAPAAPIAKGEAIEVQQGDTLYGLAKRHHVAVAELMAVNDLKNPNLKPGQKLYLPAGRVAARKPLPKPEALPKVATAPAPAAAPSIARAAVGAAPAAANWDGSYTVKSGDSPFAIARQHKVSLDELQRVNGITDPHKMRPGIVLKVPSGSGQPTTAAPAPAALPAPAAEPAEAPRVVQSTTRPSLVNGAAKQVAALEKPQTATDAPAAEPAPSKPAEAATAAPAGKFRWPVKGKVIAGFGSRPDGTHNDGVNLAVPLGTEVHAAEAGVVAYAGSELKGYGNLILVRHDSGWVTAYAHNDELLVKRGDKVKRGQSIGKAGKSGTVDQPQVHFELRQGSKPVDPLPHMEKL